ncbi:hypothetical protein BDN72DRAFT_108910 [Pluteus cervinus]|uniref:Uncharacterized protein n=1 Tax=Pluteus cervinus TaxID=181527 RepID=A0ACD3ANI7_9AGAR|nr:hypothetical protein BDN72DRAFT_108910 [Pluteus cervinus]
MFSTFSCLLHRRWGQQRYDYQTIRVALGYPAYGLRLASQIRSSGRAWIPEDTNDSPGVLRKSQRDATRLMLREFIPIQSLRPLAMPYVHDAMTRSLIPFITRVGSVGACYHIWVMRGHIPDSRTIWGKRQSDPRFLACWHFIKDPIGNAPGDS